MVGHAAPDADRNDPVELIVCLGGRLETRRSTELFFSSSNAGDTTQTVVVNGLDANFDQIGTIVTLNGQTGV